MHRPKVMHQYQTGVLVNVWHLNVGTGARRDPDMSNTKNSAHISVSEFEVSINHENKQNRKSNNDSHLYFTHEKSSSSPMNSLPRASAARWEQPGANPASMNHPQSSLCYETVGEPDKGATCSYDLGEYAEVGMHLQGEGPPDLGEYTETVSTSMWRAPLIYQVVLQSVKSLKEKRWRVKTFLDFTARWINRYMT